MSGRPLDVLEAAVGDEVDVRLKSGETYRGVLAGYDQHMNLVLEAVGDRPGSDDADLGEFGAGDADGGTADGDADGGAPDAPEDDGESPSIADAPEGEIPDEAARDTTIIRGDNVVSITP